MTSEVHLLSTALANHQMGRLDQAELYYRQLLELNARNPDGLHLLGVLLHQRGASVEGERLISRAIEINDTDPAYFANLSVLLNSLGRHAEAEAAAAKTLRLDINFADGHNNLGNAYMGQGRNEEATAAFEAALRLNPTHAVALNNLGAALQALNRGPEAVRRHRQSACLMPEFADTYFNLANAMASEGRMDQARATLDWLASLRDSLAVRMKRRMLFQVIADSNEESAADRAALKAFLDNPPRHLGGIGDPARDVGITNFQIAYHGVNDKDLQRSIAEFYIAACPRLTWTAPHCQHPRTLANRRIRVGIVSAHFGNHTIGKLNRGLLVRLPRDKFEVIAIARPRLQDPAFTPQVNLADASLILASGLDQARAQIAALELDALFYTDTGMDPLTYFLAFARLAPMQATTFGHPDTTGIPNMDYFVTSMASEPENWREHYSEIPILQRDLPTHYFAPPPPSELRDRASFGFEEDWLLYGCPQMLFKMNPDFDLILADLLGRDPRARLALITSNHAHQDARLMNRMRRTIPDVDERVIILDRLGLQDYMSLLRVCDVLLDPPVFGGGNTSLEAFAVGVPIVTYEAEFMRGRLTIDLYRQMGIEDLIATSPTDYADRAHRVATDPEWRADLSARIAAKSRVLFENPRVVEDMADFLEAGTVAAFSGVKLNPEEWLRHMKAK